MVEVTVPINKLRQLIFDFYTENDPAKLRNGLDVNGMAEWTVKNGIKSLNDLLEMQYSKHIDIFAPEKTAKEQVARISEVFSPKLNVDPAKDINNSGLFQTEENEKQILLKRLEEFYDKHDKSKLSDIELGRLVDYAMFHGVQRLNQKLVPKYGEGISEAGLRVTFNNLKTLQLPEVGAETDDDSDFDLELDESDTDFDELKMKQELRIFYQKHDPSYLEQPNNLDKIIELMQRQGKRKMLEKLYEFYKERLEDVVAEYRNGQNKKFKNGDIDLDNFEDIDKLRNDLLLYYEKHDPREIEHVDDVVSLGMEMGLDKLNKSMEQFYGESLTDFLTYYKNPPPPKMNVAQDDSGKIKNKNSMENISKDEEKSSLLFKGVPVMLPIEDSDAETIKSILSSNPKQRKQEQKQGSNPPKSPKERVSAKIPKNSPNPYGKALKRQKSVDKEEIQVSTPGFLRVKEKPQISRDGSSESSVTTIMQELSKDDEIVNTAGPAVKELKKVEVTKVKPLEKKASLILTSTNTTGNQVKSSNMNPTGDKTPGNHYISKYTNLSNPERLENSLRKFYQKHDPARLEMMSDIMELANSLGEVELNAKLTEFYGENLYELEGNQPVKSSATYSTDKTDSKKSTKEKPIYKPQLQEITVKLNQEVVANESRVAVNEPGDVSLEEIDESEDEIEEDASLDPNKLVALPGLTVNADTKVLKKISMGMNEPAVFEEYYKNFYGDELAFDDNDMDQLRKDLKDFYAEVDPDKIEALDQIMKLAEKLGRRELDEKLTNFYGAGLNKFVTERKKKELKAKNQVQVVGLGSSISLKKTGLDPTRTLAKKKEIKAPKPSNVKPVKLKQISEKNVINNVKGSNNINAKKKKNKKKHRKKKGVSSALGKGAEGSNAKRVTNARLKLLSTEMTKSHSEDVNKKKDGSKRPKIPITSLEMTEEEKEKRRKRRAKAATAKLEAGPCDNYRLDMTGDSFGVCKCGYPRSRHKLYGESKPSWIKNEL